MQFSLRELEAMLEGHRKDSWLYTSHILAFIASTFSKAKVDPDDLNPTKAPYAGVTTGDVKAVKNASLGQLHG